MASIRFVIENDQTEELSVTGSLLDILTYTTYLINKIYYTLRQSDPRAAAAFRSMISRTVSSPDSPVWEDSTVDGERSIAIHLPNQNQDG